MAKKKKRRKSSKPVARSPRRSSFVGDHILALYQMIGSCCGFTALTLIGSIAMGFAATAGFKKQIAESITDKEILAQINSLNPSHGIIVFVIAALLLIFGILFIRATWNGRKWAMWLHLLLNLPSAAITIIFGQADGRIGSIIPIVVSIYCLLRIAGSVGPKL